jgi:hypothetical protein
MHKRSNMTLPEKKIKLFFPFVEKGENYVTNQQ